MGSIYCVHTLHVHTIRFFLGGSAHCGHTYAEAVLMSPSLDSIKGGKGQTSLSSFASTESQEEDDSIVAGKEGRLYNPCRQHILENHNYCMVSNQHSLFKCLPTWILFLITNKFLSVCLEIDHSNPTETMAGPT